MITKIKRTDHDEWLELRRNYIGGSDAAAVLGLNPYTSPYALWAEKTGKTPPFEGNISTRVGNYLEDFVATLFEEQACKKVRRRNCSLINSEYPYAIADVDRVVVGEDALLEIKVTASLPTLKLFKKGQYPDSWYCQVMHYLMVTGYKKAYIAALVMNRDLVIYEIERDENEIKSLAESESAFMEFIKNDTPPPVDGSDSTSDTLQTIYTGENGADCVDLMGLGHVFSRREELSRQLKECEKALSECDNIIKAEMGNSTRAVCGDYSVSWSLSTRRTLDIKAFESANGKISDDYFKSTPVRTFKLTKVKGA